MVEAGNTGAGRISEVASWQGRERGDGTADLVGRRAVLGAGVAVAALGSTALGARQDPAAAAKPVAADPKPLRISLAQWSLHKSLFAGAVKPLDFPLVAARDHGIRGVEYVNSFYKDLVGKEGFAEDLRRRCGDAGVTSVLIMCDGEGALGDQLGDFLKEKLTPAGGKPPRVRADTFGYVQRCWPDSSVIDRIEARRSGRFAAQLALQGHQDGSVAIRRTGSGSEATSVPTPGDTV